jgi:glycerol-3-phosphate acyltransferase PlsY
MKALKTVATILGILLAAAVVIPLVVLAGLFVWLKLTEESDEEALELEQEGV